MFKLDIMYLCAGDATRAKDYTQEGKISKHSIQNQDNKTPMSINLEMNQKNTTHSFILTKEEYVKEYETFKSRHYVCPVPKTKETSNTVKFGTKLAIQTVGKFLNNWVIIYCGDNVYNTPIDTYLSDLILNDENKHLLYSIGVKVDKPEDFINLQADGSWKDKTTTYVSDYVMAGVWAVRWKDLNKWTQSEKWDNSLPIWKNLEKFLKPKDIYCPQTDIKFLDVGTPERIEEFKKGGW